MSGFRSAPKHVFFLAYTTQFDTMQRKSAVRCIFSKSGVLRCTCSVATYLCSALRSTGVIKSATAPPIRVVNSWGHANMVGSIFNMGGASTTTSPSFLPKRAPEARPQMTFTTSRYKTPNLTPAATANATGCRQIGLWVLPAINRNPCFHCVLLNKMQPHQKKVQLQ